MCFLVEDAYSSESKSLLNATTRESPSIQNAIQMSAFEAMTFCESGLTSLPLDRQSQQLNNFTIIEDARVTSGPPDPG